MPQAHPNPSTSPVPAEIDFNYEITQGFASNFIRRTASALARQSGFSPSDQDDLQQEMLIHVLERLPQFDPTKGCFNAFVKLLVKQYTSNVCRHVRAQKRDRRNDMSLSLFVQGEGGLIELAQIVGPNELNSRLAREERPQEELVDLSHDITTFLKTLPPRLRKIAKRLPDRSVAQIAKELCLHRSTVHAEVRKLQVLFSQAGFQNYLPTHRQ